jgi:hypothetical protein
MKKIALLVSIVSVLVFTYGVQAKQASPEAAKAAKPELSDMLDFKRHVDDDDPTVSAMKVKIGARCTMLVYHANLGGFSCEGTACIGGGDIDMQGTLDGIEVTASCPFDCTGVKPDAEGNCDCEVSTTVPPCEVY